MTGPSITTERELRFDVAPAFEPPDLRPVAGQTVRLPEQQIRTTYVDTPDMRLWDHGITLRHRQTLAEGDLPGEEGPGTWTLELPGALLDGEESDPLPPELTWPGVAGTVPPEATRILAGIVRRQSLHDVATLSATRQRLLLRNPEADETWAEIDDDLVTVTAGPEPGRQFRRMELELSAGADAFAVAAEAVLEELRSAGAAPTERPKLAMVLGLPEGQPPGPVGQRAGRGVKHVVAGALSDGLKRLEIHDLGLRLAADGIPSVRDVHQARVATRRLRSVIRSLGPAVDPLWAEHVTDDLRWAGTALGAVRDLDVITRHLEERRRPDNAIALEGLLQLARAQRTLAAQRLAGVLAEPRYLDLLDRLHAGAVTPPLTGTEPRDTAERLLQGIVAGEYRKFAKRARRLDADPDDRSLHRLRIKAKRLRYAAETATPTVGKSARRTARRAKKVQTVLGEVHDAAAMAAWLREQAEQPSITPAAAFVAGQLACEVRNEAHGLGASWRRSVRRMSDKKIARAW